MLVLKDLCNILKKKKMTLVYSNHDYLLFDVAMKLKLLGLIVTQPNDDSSTHLLNKFGHFLPKKYRVKLLSETCQ